MDFRRLLSENSRVAIKSYAAQRRLPRGTTVLIHIGKCGGSTLRAAARDSTVYSGLHIVHIAKPVYRPDLKYLIVVRNPIRRAASAFAWRFHLVMGGRQKNRFPREREALERYGTLSKLGETLYDEYGHKNPAAHADLRRIHHLREDISFYLDPLLRRCRPEQILAVLAQENLDDDTRRVFGVTNVPRRKDNRMRQGPVSELSERAERNLRRYFVADFEALMRLYAYGKIDREVFQALI